MTLYLLGAFLISLICGAFSIPVILDYCKRKKIYDMPNDRKVHHTAVPRLGGISFFPSMILAFCVSLLFLSWNHHDTQPINIWSASFLVGLVFIYAVGIIDDLSGLNATTKFTVQIFTACLLPMTGLYINNLYGFCGIHEIPNYVGIPLTIFVIVFIDNAINLIDGIDGLAASLSLLALSGFLVYFVHYHVYTYTYSILVAGMMGALVIFLYFNMLGRSDRNTKIFMGDSGSLSIGFTLGFLAIKCAMNNELIWPYREEALLVPSTLLFVPAADVVRVTLFRIYHRRPLFSADKNHIHHKLMRAGLSQHQSLACILALAVAYIVVNFLLYQVVSTTLIILIDVAIYCFVNMCINQFINSMYLKRTFDCVASAICLIIFSPLLLLCFLAIKISGGPAIYKQERIGLGGQSFYIYKFRSMKTNAEENGVELLQSENDPRLTRVGKFLRKHHLDELPQLWNVFVGDMSFVGYRPERPYYIRLITERDKRYEQLYKIRPGVTSYATLYNGYTDTIEKMLRRLDLDLYYMEHQSMRTDLKLLGQTFFKIVIGKKF